MAFPPARGGGSPFAALLGGIGPLMQGLMQGRMMRDQEQMQQQELQGDKLKNAMSVFSMLGQIGQSDPQALSSPQMAAFAKQNFAGSGLPLPTDKNGGIDLNVFKTPVSAFTSSPAFEKFIALPKGSNARKAMAQNLGGTPDEIQQLIDLDQQYSPPEVDNAANQMKYITGLVVNNGLDINDPRNAGVIDTYNRYADIAGAPHWTGATMSAKAKTGIDNTQSKTDLNKANTGLVNKKTQWYDQVQQAQIDNWHSLTNLHNQQAWAVPKEVQARLTSASAAAERANDDTARVNMELDSFHKLGVTPQAAQAYTGVMNSLQNNVNQQRTAVTAITNSIANILKANNGTEPKAGTTAKKTLDFLRQSLANHNGQLNTSIQQLQGFQTGRKVFLTQVARRLGLPGNAVVTDHPNAWWKPATGLTPTQNTAWTAIESLDKNAALKAIQSATGLSNTDKAALIKRIKLGH